MSIKSLAATFGATGEAEVVFAEGTSPLRVSWKSHFFRKSATPFFLAHTFLEIPDLRIKTSGFGYAFLPTVAKQRAFGEAWERSILHRIHRAAHPLANKFCSSNGLAAHTDSKKAQQYAVNELIERKIFLEAWAYKVGWYPHVKLAHRARFLTRYVSTFGASLRFYQIRTEASFSVLIGVLVHRGLGLFVDSVLIGHRESIKNAELKLSMSLISELVTQDPLDQGDGHQSLPAEGNPRDHRRFYCHYRNDDIFGELCSVSTGKKSLLPFKTRDLLAIETCLLYEGKNMPFVAGAFHPDWKRLSWGEQSIFGTNDLPQPLV